MVRLRFKTPRRADFLIAACRAAFLLASLATPAARGLTCLVAVAIPLLEDPVCNATQTPVLRGTPPATRTLPEPALESGTLSEQPMRGGGSHVRTQRPPKNSHRVGSMPTLLARFDGGIS